MTGTVFGVMLLLCGAALILFRKPIAEVLKSIAELFGMGAPPHRWYEINGLVFGIVLVILGVLFILQIAKVR